MGDSQQAINLSNLTLDQLTMLKQQVEEDVQQLSNSAAQLRSAASRYIECKESAHALKGQKGKELLVPLTSSTIPQASDYADRKIKMITDQVNKLQHAINVKRNNLDSVVQVMQEKIMQLQV